MPVQAGFPDRLRLPLDFEPSLLAAEMANFSSSEWIEHFVKQNYDGDWSVIALRAPAGARHPVQTIYSDPGCSDFEDTALLLASPYFRTVLGRFACPLHAVRLMRPTPGSVIKEHRDHGLSFEDGMVRIHIPVMTNTSVDFRLNGARVVMPTGSSWYLRLSDPHNVANRGTADRVHLGDRCRGQRLDRRPVQAGGGCCKRPGGVRAGKR